MWRYRTLGALLLIAAFQKGEVRAANPAPPAGSALEACRTIPDDALRLRCFEDATSNSTQTPSAPESSGGWRLVRTPGPKPGDEVTSMMRTADLLHSDPEFAGLALHCGHSGPEILLFVVEPFPPRSRPRITLGGPPNEIHFEASVLPSGAALLLPDEAMVLASGPWQSQTELSIRIEDGHSVIHGAVLLGGLNAALGTLKASCAKQ